MQPDALEDFEWADQFTPAVFRILATLPVGTFMQAHRASATQDMRHATDVVLTFSLGDVAVRIRRDVIRYRDLTLRYRRRRGNEWVSHFEVSKILAGFARWYFYAWARSGDIGEWVVVDLNIVRDAALIEDAIDAGREKFNEDGDTTFTWVTLGELQGVGAVVASDLRSTSGTYNGQLLPTYDEVVADFKARPLHSHCSCASCRRIRQGRDL